MITVTLSRYGHEREVTVSDMDMVRELVKVYGHHAVRNHRGDIYILPEQRDKVRRQRVKDMARRDAKRKKEMEMSAI